MSDHHEGVATAGWGTAGPVPVPYAVCGALPAELSPDPSRVTCSPCKRTPAWRDLFPVSVPSGPVPEPVGAGAEPGDMYGPGDE